MSVTFFGYRKGYEALVHTMPAPTVLLPCAKGLNPRPSTNNRSQP